MLTCLMLIAASMLSPNSGQQVTRPHALAQLDAYRASAVRSGEFRWEVLSEADETKALSFVTRMAKNGDLIFEHRGDPDGWTGFDPSTGSGRSRYPVLMMMNADGFWEWQETLPNVGVCRGDMANGYLIVGARNILAVGMQATSAGMAGLEGRQLLWAGLPGTDLSKVVSYRETKNGSRWTVTADLGHDSQIVWEIDAARGWNPERIVLSQHGDETHVVHNALREFDGVWLPERTEYYLFGELSEVVRIRDARLNRDDDPAEFTGRDLGLEPGFNVGFKDATDGRVRAWNGDAVVAWEDWIRDVDEGRRSWGPTMAALNAGEPFVSPYMTEAERPRSRKATASTQADSADWERAWRRYVDSFIARHALDAEQTQKARAILNESLAVAQQRLAPKRDEMGRIREQLATPKKAGADARSKLLEQLEVNFAPVHEVFRNQLVPRLNNLLTRKQRRAAPEPDGTDSAARETSALRPEPLRDRQ